jgi:hypothetical protein
MTRPPEYDRVALWLRAFTGEPGLVEDIKTGYSGRAPTAAGLTREKYAGQQRQRLADDASRELFGVWFDGISLESANLDQVAEAYHQHQVADYAHRQGALQARIRELADGTFEVPSWCPDRAAREGTDLRLVIEDYRQGALAGARAELGVLPGRYDVTEGEVQAYRAAQRHGAARHLIDGHHADPATVARDAPTLDLLRGIHDAAHRYLEKWRGPEDDPHERQQPWGQLVMQARADDWWAERDRKYRNRPEILQEIGQLRADAGKRATAEAAYLESLEQRAEAGWPGAQQQLDEAMTRQALDTDPPEPSAKEDPGEWEAFFREVLGRDMPENAAYEAEHYRINAAAPPDVGGMAAAYYEANPPSGTEYGELETEREGLTLEQLYLQRYRELRASEATRSTTANGPQAGRLAAATFPGPVPASPAQQDDHNPASQIRSIAMPEPDDRQGTRLAPGQHPLLEDMTDAVRLMDDAAGFLSPTREYDEPGFTDWPRDLDGQETLAMMRQLAGIVDATGGCLAGITCQHAVADTAKPELEEIAALLTRAAGKLHVLSGTAGREPGTTASPVLHAGQDFPHRPMARWPADPAQEAASRTAPPPAAGHRNTP